MSYDPLTIRRRWTAGCFFLVAALAAAPTQAAAQDRSLPVEMGRAPGSRVALVIGNSAYASAPLENPVNDARDIGVALTQAGFQVTTLLDRDLRSMKDAVRAFGEQVKQAEVAAFYYAGHGIQVDGRNYLVPVGANIERESDVEFEALDAGVLLAQLDYAGTPLSLVILDACRNNPFARSFRSGTRGLASIDAPSGTLIAYATAPGSVASDGNGANGLYTQEFLRHMRTPGLALEDVFKRVRVSVMEISDGRQTPWESSSLTGDFYFFPGDRAEGAPPLPPPVTDAEAATRVPTRRGTSVAVILDGGLDPSGAEAGILQRLLNRSELTPVDAAGLTSMRGDSGVLEAALGGDARGIVVVARPRGVEFVVVGRLTSEATPSVGSFYTGRSRLELRLYQVSTSRLVETQIFDVGFRGTPGVTGTSETDARMSAESRVAELAAARAERWIRQLRDDSSPLH